MDTNKAQLVAPLLWDSTMSPERFLGILEQTDPHPYHTQEWAISRVLEHSSYYDTLRLVPLATLRKHWDTVQTKLFHSDIKKGYGHVLHHLPLSATG